ncbi:MAG: hypothetical protein HW421_2533 [Ignavibacteria bacterium]|nr:hypothetical protein [Ignavibacteria bacterium]
MNDIDTDFFVAIAHSEDPETNFAMEEIIDTLKKKLNGRTPKACIVFSGVNMEHKLILDSINSEWHNIKLIGCTSEGELSSDLGFAEGSISVIMFDSDSVDFSVGLGRNNMGDLEGACKNAVSEVLNKSDKVPCLCITTPDCLLLSGDKLIRLLKKELGQGIPVFGGAATDGFKFTTTYQFFGTEVYTNSIPILLFSGPLSFSYGVRTGTTAIGRSGKVTRSENKIVHEIDNKPAIEFYRSIMGDNIIPSFENPLTILDNQGCPLYLRTAVGLPNTETGEVTIYSDISVASEIKISVADRDSLLEGSKDSVRTALERFPKDKEVKLAFFFTCAGRKYLLGTRTKEEIELAKTVLTPGTQIFGSYGYGEIAPLESNIEEIHLNDGTFVTLLIG